MPKFNLFRRKKQKPETKSETIPLQGKEPIPQVSSPSWLQRSADWLNYLNDFVQDIWDIFYRVEWRSYQTIDEDDRRILAEQNWKAQQRSEYQKANLKRKNIIRNNHKDDVARIKTKTDICKNWEKAELGFLNDQVDKFYAINPGPEIDPIKLKIPGWEVKEGDSQFRGTTDLCRSLKCSDSNMIAPIFDNRNNFDNSYSFINQLQDLELEKQSCLKENLFLSNQYQELRSSIERQAYQQKQLSFERQTPIYKYLSIDNGRNAIGSQEPSLDSKLEPVPGFYQPTGETNNDPENDPEFDFKLLVRFLFFPTEFLNKNGWFWKDVMGIKPFLFVPTTMFGLTGILWVLLCFLAIYLLIKFLAIVEFIGTKAVETITTRLTRESKSKFKAKEDLQKRKRKFRFFGRGKEGKEKETSRSKLILDSILKMVGGASEESFGSFKPEKRFVQIDLIFRWIKRQKLQPELRKEYSVKELWKVPIQRISMMTNELRNKPVLASMVLTIVLVNQDLGKPFSRTHIISTNQPNQRSSKIFEQISERTETKRSSNHIEVGDSILSFTSSNEENFEPVKVSDDLENSVKDPEKPRVKKTVKRRAKMVRFSDLAPLDSHQFDDILTEGNFIRTQKVRIPLQTNRYPK